MSGEAARAAVLRYYADLWNRWDLDLVPAILHPKVTFRGSLGETVHGHDGFRAYVERVRSAFPDFRNEVEDLVVEGDRVAARLTYTGTHRGSLFGLPPRGRRVRYRGIAIFVLEDGRIRQGWVVGDTLALYRQVTDGRTERG